LVKAWAKETSRRINGVLDKTVELAAEKRRAAEADADQSARRAFEELSKKTEALTAAFQARTNRRMIFAAVLAFVAGLAAGWLVASFF
jgi:hypothetical protein